MDRNKFYKIASRYEHKKNVVLDLILAFVMGGFIGVLGQWEYDLLTKVIELDKNLSSSLVSITFIVVSTLLTAFGIYKRLGQIFGAGLFIPITGFANSVVSASMEGRFEGPIYGVGSKIFSLAGSVITYGVFGTFVYGLIIWILTLCGVSLW